MHYMNQNDLQEPWIIIRACPERREYVKKFLIPSITLQGLSPQHILIWEDIYHEGNLTSFLKMMVWIYENMAPETALWLMQDDVLVSSSFVERIKEFNDFDGCVCGYCCDVWNKQLLKRTGEQMNVFKWFSFPCEKVPIRYIGEFLQWYQEATHKEGPGPDKMREWISQNKFDDSFWLNFLLQRRPIERCWNVGQIIDGVPQGGLVEHVDYLLGGSKANEDWGDRRRLNYFWNEQERTKELEKRFGYVGK